jgi:hypothetical protein
MLTGERGRELLPTVRFRRRDAEIVEFRRNSLPPEPPSMNHLGESNERIERP